MCNGHPGTVSKLTDYGMIEVRTESGGVCVDPNDELTVQPGEIWAQMCKFAESDMRKARKEGSILIAQTRRGTVELTYHAPGRRYEVHTWGLDARFVCCGTAKDVVARIASLYQIGVA